MKRSPRKTLIALVKEYQSDICQNPRRCRAFLLDLCGEYSSEIFVLISSIEEGIVATLQELNCGIVTTGFIEQLAQRLCDNRAIKYPLAVWGVESWSLALDLITPHECQTTEFIDLQTETVFISQSENDLRKALFEALEDGIITESEKLELQKLSIELNIPRQIANQIFIEVKADKQSAGSKLPDTLIVSKDNSGHFSSIHQALARAKPYSKILLQPGTYMETLTINKPVVIIGQGNPEQIIIKQIDNLSLKLNTMTATIRGITFYCQEGSPKHYPVCFLKSGQLVLEDCRLIAGSHATLPCLIIDSEEAGMTLKNCYIKGQNGGVLISEGSQCKIQKSFIQGGRGVGISVQKSANLNLTKSQISTSSVGLYIYGKGLLQENNINSKNIGIILDRESQAILHKCDIKQNKVGIIAKSEAHGKVENCLYQANSEIAIDIKAHASTAFLWNQIKNNHLGMRIEKSASGMVMDNQFSQNKKHWKKPRLNKLLFKRNRVI